MKKKIKDLTIKECEKICYKYYDCNKCPLHYKYQCRLVKLEVDEAEKIFNLERELEIDE